MDWIGLICNVVALFLGLAIFLIFSNSEFGKRYAKYQYPIMAACLLIAVLIGGLVRKVFGI